MEYLRGRDLARVARRRGAPAARAHRRRPPADARGARRGARARHRPPRPEAGQHRARAAALGARLREGGRLRPGEDPRGRALASHGGGALTRPGLVCGTPEYMSPEQGRGDALDGRSDLYSLGIVLFELLAGRVPFAGDSATKTLLLQLNEPPPDPRNVAPDRGIPAAFAELTLRALAKPREDRFQSARELAAALEEALVSVEGRRRAPSPSTATRCRACGALNAHRTEVLRRLRVAHRDARRRQPARSPLARPGAPRSDGDASVDAATMHRARRGRQRGRTRCRSSRAPTRSSGSRPGGTTPRRCSRRPTSSATRAAARRGSSASSSRGARRAATSSCRSAPDAVVGQGGRHGGARRRARPGLPRARRRSRATGAPRAPRRCTGLEILLGDSRRVAASSDPRERRRALAEALRWALERAAERAGRALVVLVVDDIDFIDGTSRNAFADLLAEPPVVGALRARHVRPGRAPGDRDARRRDVDARPPSARDVRPTCCPRV